MSAVAPGAALPAKKILVITGHSVDVGPIASALFIAEEWHRQKNDVTVLSIDTKNSLVGRVVEFTEFGGRAVTGKYRGSYAAFRWVPIVIPPNARRNSRPFFSKACTAVFEWTFQNAIRAISGDYDVICIESGFGVLGCQILRQRWPSAKMLYMANDLLETLGFNAEVLRVEAAAFSNFDLIRCPASLISDEIESKTKSKVLLLRHGIHREPFDNCVKSPYPRDKNAIAVGTMLFDGAQIEQLAAIFPDWLFHVFGPAGKSQTDNVIYYGFREFREIIPYLKFADIGLLPYRFKQSAAYLVESSLKSIQYQYVGLPTCGPQFALSGINQFGYQTEDAESMRRAFTAAFQSERAPYGSAGILSWSQVAENLLRELSAV